MSTFSHTRQMNLASQTYHLIPSRCVNLSHRDDICILLALNKTQSFVYFYITNIKSLIRILFFTKGLTWPFFNIPKRNVGYFCFQTTFFQTLPAPYLKWQKSEKKYFTLGIYIFKSPFSYRNHTKKQSNLFPKIIGNLSIPLPSIVSVWLKSHN